MNMNNYNKLDEWTKDSGLENSKLVIVDDIIPKEKVIEWNFWEEFDFILTISHTLQEAYDRVEKITIPSEVKLSIKDLQKQTKDRYELELKQYKIEKVQRGLTDATCWWYKT